LELGSEIRILGIRGKKSGGLILRFLASPSKTV
jgi:hypothetical protein